MQYAKPPNASTQWKETSIHFDDRADLALRCIEAATFVSGLRSKAVTSCSDVVVQPTSWV